MNAPTQEQYRAYFNQLATFKSSECGCKSCRSLCALVPCMGTPHEIKAIIDAGRKHILARRWNVATMCHGMPPLDMVMVRPIENGTGCSQFDGQHCLLHHTGLKPSEGKFATHDEKHSSFWAIASTWFLDENAELVASLLAQFPEPAPVDELILKVGGEFAKLVRQQLAELDPADFVALEEIASVSTREFMNFIKTYEVAMALKGVIEGAAIEIVV